MDENSVVDKGAQNKNVVGAGKFRPDPHDDVLFCTTDSSMDFLQCTAAPMNSMLQSSLPAMCNSELTKKHSTYIPYLTVLYLPSSPPPRSARLFCSLWPWSARVLCSLCLLKCLSVVFPVAPLRASSSACLCCSLWPKSVLVAVEWPSLVFLGLLECPYLVSLCP
jgi:hypothetical protein